MLVVNMCNVHSLENGKIRSTHIPESPVTEDHQQYQPFIVSGPDNHRPLMPIKSFDVASERIWEKPDKLESGLAGTSTQEIKPPNDRY